MSAGQSGETVSDSTSLACQSQGMLTEANKVEWERDPLLVPTSGLKVMKTRPDDMAVFAATQ
jgi:hypothetical protein